MKVYDVNPHPKPQKQEKMNGLKATILVF